MSNVSNSNSDVRVVFTKRPGVNGEPTPDCFGVEKLTELPVDNPTSKQCRVRTLYLSVDPASRCQMNETTGVQYLAPWTIGETIQGLGGVGIVEQAGPDSMFKTGQHVTAALFWPWQTRWIAADSELQPVAIPPNHEASVVPSVLGVIGLTVLIGLQEKAHLKPGLGQTIVVSGAAGACGILTGQIAQLLGAERVIGICGSDEKCSMLVQDYGYDASINYKTDTNIQQKLKQLCPSGVQVYFDNVGGAISDAVVVNMTKDSHVVLCGQISQYNQDLPYPPPMSEQMSSALTNNNITRERFLVLNYQEKFEAALAQLYSWLAENKLKTRETLVQGVENTGVAFCDMMKGRNIGKMLVKA